MQAKAAFYGPVRIPVRMGPQHSLLVGHGELKTLTQQV